MAATWKINGESTADLNVSNLKIVLRNHAEDVATWTCEGDGLTGTARWSYGSMVDIWMGTRRVFQGVVTSIPREGTGEAERVSYEARGGWYWLGKCFYTQEWAVGDAGGRQSKTRVILGGTSRTPTSQIRDILSCAVRAGAPLRLGNVSVASSKVPEDEEIDLTCANAIDRVLAWFPDTVVWFDYGGSGKPAVNIRRRASLGSLSLPVDQVAESVSATPRHDLVVPGVEIVYEITSTKDNRQFRNVSIDAAGDASALGAARFTVQLDGGSVSHVRQHLATSRITDGDLKNPDWWARRIPELKGWTGPDGTGKPQITVTSEFPKINGATLDKEIVSGNVPPWLRNAVAQSVPIECTASYALGGESIKDRALRLSLTLTNAISGLYSSVQSRQEGEAVPKGLAAQIFAAVRHLYYQGSVRFVGEDPPQVFHPGYRLNLTGGLSAWSKMDSAIQSLELDAGSGATVYSFGPPEHLGPQDLVQLAQANRKRAEARSAAARTNADLSTSAPSVGGPAPDTSSGHAGGIVSKLRISTGSDAPSAPVLEVTPNGLSLTKNGQTTVWPSGSTSSPWAFEATATSELDGNGAPTGYYTVKVLGGTAQAVGGSPAVFPTLTVNHVANGEYFYIRFSVWNNSFAPTCYWYNDPTGATGTIEHGQSLPTPSGNTRFIVLVLAKIDSSAPEHVVQYRAGAIDIDATLAAGVAGSGITVRTISS